MAAVRREFTERVLEEYAKRGLLAEVAEAGARRSLVILAKPDIGGHKVPLSFRRPDWMVEPTLWFDKWWAKLLRKVEHWARRRLGRPLLPAWLDSLVYSESVTVGHKKESLPAGAMDRIAAMANYLRHYEEAEPSKVLVGRKAMFDLRESLCADYWPGAMARCDGPSGVQVLGLGIQVSPFLAEDEILVV